MRQLDIVDAVADNEARERAWTMPEKLPPLLTAMRDKVESLMWFRDVVLELDPSVEQRVREYAASSRSPHDGGGVCVAALDRIP